MSFFLTWGLTRFSFYLEIDEVFLLLKVDGVLSYLEVDEIFFLPGGS